MCNWAGRAASWLGRLTSRMKADLLTGARLFVDETTAKDMATGTGKVKTGYLWAIARDDGAHDGTDPPPDVYTYMPGCGILWADTRHGALPGIAQCDGFRSNMTTDVLSKHGGPGTRAFCLAAVRRASIG